MPTTTPGKEGHGLRAACCPLDPIIQGITCLDLPETGSSPTHESCCSCSARPAAFCFAPPEAARHCSVRPRLPAVLQPAP